MKLSMQGDTTYFIKSKNTFKVAIQTVHSQVNLRVQKCMIKTLQKFRINITKYQLLILVFIMLHSESVTCSHSNTWPTYPWE
jgi:hypothetical protein